MINIEWERNRLGLATAHGIVKQHVNPITCYSELGVGNDVQEAPCNPGPSSSNISLKTYDLLNINC
jgi:hypothetical protein